MRGSEVRGSGRRSEGKARVRWRESEGEDQNERVRRRGSEGEAEREWVRGCRRNRGRGPEAVGERVRVGVRTRGLEEE